MPRLLVLATFFELAAGATSNQPAGTGTDWLARGIASATLSILCLLTLAGAFVFHRVERRMPGPSFRYRLGRLVVAALAAPAGALLGVVLYARFELTRFTGPVGSVADALGRLGYVLGATSFGGLAWMSLGFAWALEAVDLVLPR